MPMNSRMEQIRRAQQGEKEVRDRLISENLGLVHVVVRRFENRGHDREELFQIGSIGLMKALDKFDVTLGLAFSTYAVPMITGEIRRFLRDDGMVKVSRTLMEHAALVKREKEKFEHEKGMEPGLLELSEATGLSVEEIVLSLEANARVESIYQPVYQADGDELLLIDQISGQGSCEGAHEKEEPEKERLLNEILVQQLLARLDEKERQLLKYRYFEGLTQMETAKRMQTNQVQVSRMEKKLLLLLRREMQK